MKLAQLLELQSCHVAPFGNGSALVVYPTWFERFEFYRLDDYKVSASISAGGLVLVPTVKPEMYSALVS